MSLKAFYSLCIFLCIACFTHAQYKTDILGEDYISKAIQMPDDYEGKVVCTLVKKQQKDTINQAILYIHGYNDYFFQKELGDSISRHGYNFYALDLRKYGRSILPHQDPFYCQSLTEYFADIDTAITTIRNEGNERILLMAHSTGGLITSYFLSCKQGKSGVDGLILNSPFLDWNLSWFMETLVMPTVSFIGRFFPRLTVQGLGSPFYAHSLLQDKKGEWNFNTNWKMPFGHPKKAGWIRAIHEVQRVIQNHPNIKEPILVLSSDKSFPGTDDWNEEYKQSDIILDVKDIQNIGAQLGPNVSQEMIPNGLHDLFLSAKAFRDKAYQTIFNWLNIH